ARRRRLRRAGIRESGCAVASRMEYGEGTFFSEPWERLSLSPNRIRELGEIQPALSRISGILLPGTLFFVAGNTRVGGSYRSNMKAIHLFRLRVVMGIA